MLATFGDGNDPIRTNETAFALLRVCRQVYTESAALPYTLNIFATHCRVERDVFAAVLNFVQLEAIQTVEIWNPYIMDAINGTGFGGCTAGKCQGPGCSIDQNYHTRSRTVPVMPFSLLFPNLRKIRVEGGGSGSDLEKLNEPARRLGMENWKDYVKMRERGGVEAVEIIYSQPHQLGLELS